VRTVLFHGHFGHGIVQYAPTLAWSFWPWNSTVRTEIDIVILAME